MTAPTPPAGIEARTSPLGDLGCVGEWLVRTGPHDGLRIHFYDRPEGRHLVLSGYVANARPVAQPGQASAIARALLRADDWCTRTPKADEPQLTFDLLEAS